MTTSRKTPPLKTLAISSLFPAALVCGAACTVPSSGGPMGQAADAAPEVDAAELQFSTPPKPGVVGPSHSRPVPMYVSTRQADPRFLALAQDTPFWVDDSFGSRGLRTKGSGEHETLSDMAFEGMVVASASNESGVYWASSDSNLYFNSWKEGRSIEIARFDTLPVKIAITDKSLYWLSASGCLARLSPDDRTSETLACAPGVPEHLAVTDSAAFWTTDEGFLFQLEFAPERSAEVIAKGKFISGIVADTNGVYWYDGNTRELMRFHRNDGEVNSLLGPQRSMVTMTQDRFYLYFTTPTDGGVKRVLKTGTEDVEVLALDQQNPTEIVVSAKSVYWVNTGEGAVMRLPSNYDY